MWREIEADFLRDYGVQIDRELHHMSWRRFEALFSGLSPDGAVARALIRAGDPASMAHHTDPIGQRAASREFLQWLRVKGIRKDDQICSSGN